MMGSNFAGANIMPDFIPAGQFDARLLSFQFSRQPEDPINRMLLKNSENA